MKKLLHVLALPLAIAIVLPLVVGGLWGGIGPRLLAPDDLLRHQHSLAFSARFWRLNV